MKIYKRIIASVSFLLGLMFLVNLTSDIQLGFGCVLIIMGLLNLQ